MTNGGGVRAGLKVKADKSITWGAAQDVQPFGNMLYVVSMTGQQIYDVLNQQYKNGRTYLLISGLKYDFTDNRDSSQPYKVPKVYDNSGKELDLNKKYNVVINDFLKMAETTSLNLLKEKYWEQLPQKMILKYSSITSKIRLRPVTPLQFQNLIVKTTSLINNCINIPPTLLLK